MSHAERILELLGRQPGLDDDELAKLAGIQPRQQVNQICRRLETQGVILRRPGPSGKIGNFLVAGAAQRAAVPKVPSYRPRVIDEATHTQRISDFDLGISRDTLILIPCSGRKNIGVRSTGGCAPITDDLPSSLAQRLQEARRPVLVGAGVDEHQPVPAWQRYGGMFYTCAGSALAKAVNGGFHILIVSGGYGVVKACEPIGNYSTRLHLAAWPRGLLEEVMVAYAARHGLKSVRAFVSNSTDYSRVVRRARWRDVGIEDAMILAPEAARGAMVKAPRAQGEALAAFLSGRLTDDWRSSDGLRLDVSKAS